MDRIFVESERADEVVKRLAKVKDAVAGHERGFRDPAPVLVPAVETFDRALHAYT